AASFHLADQEIHEDEKAEADIHPEKRRKHELRHLQGYYFRGGHENDRADERYERADDARRDQQTLSFLLHSARLLRRLDVYEHVGHERREAENDQQRRNPDER